MKRLLLFVSLSIISFTIAAQVPQAFNYQAVLRESSGVLIQDQQVQMRMSILLGSADGNTVYSETHTCTTNNFGQVNPAIGTGTAETGDFSQIDWTSGTYFLKTEVDPEGGSNYTNMGITQLLAVPYALQSTSAASLPSMTTQQRDAIQNPVSGMTINNLTTNCLNYYVNERWYEICGNCTPLPTAANAGPDQLNLTDTTAILAGNVPVNGTGIWTVVSGNGGSIDDPLNPSSAVHGTAGTTYQLKWTISTPCGSSEDEVIIGFSAIQSCQGIPVVNYAGQTYHTVQIGTQCWLKENLNVGSWINSTVSGFQQANNGIIEKYCYNNLPENCNVYGGLYEWPEAMQYATSEGAQGICPDGWHIPTVQEWNDLITHLGGSSVAGGKLKSTGNLEEGSGLWKSPNEGATNESGFTAFPAGDRSNSLGYFYGIGYDCYYWASSQIDENDAGYLFLNYDYPNSYLPILSKDNGFSLRCIRNN
ncbi:MAG TPA: FISUMP domain-containing protein [Bacteroidales bacterium]|nr:FISUMP domain-containing protein [Bacteroidales bacterium]HNS46540.1 FISUMP domain-containing protein [Bacteroidales bacterium]